MSCYSALYSAVNALLALLEILLQIYPASCLPPYGCISLIPDTMCLEGSWSQMSSHLVLETVFIPGGHRFALVLRGFELLSVTPALISSLHVALFVLHRGCPK